MSDWCGDRPLHSCSLAARGLWLEMIAIMYQATPKGSLLIGQIQVNIDDLARSAGAERKEVEKLMRELEAKAIFSRDPNGTIFSRRIRREVEKAERDRINGKKGGNPSLNGPDKPSDIRVVNGRG